MYVKDVITKTCDFIDEREIKEALASGETLSAQQSEKVDKLLTAVNLVCDEVAREYQPILQVENFVVKNFKLPLCDFAFEVADILSVKDKLGRNVKYKIFEDYVFVCGREIEVIYSSVPDALGIDDDFFSTLPERAIAYGAAREYFFMNGKYDDANAWEERFKNSLQVLLRRKSEVKMPRRRWL